MKKILPIKAPRSFVSPVANLLSGTVEQGKNPIVLRTTHESQDITIGSRVFQKGLLQGVPLQNTSATLTVVNNDFTSVAKLFLGGYEILSNVDYISGALVANTAANLTATINNLAEFTATVLGAAITINYTKGIALVPFEVQYYGGITNFTLVPFNRFMLEGNTHIGPPLLT